MRPHHGWVEHDPVQLGGLQGFEQAFPHAFLGQAAEAFAHGIGGAEAFGQVRPRAADAHYSNQYVEKQLVVVRCHAIIGSFPREKRENCFPSAVDYFVITHIFIY